MSVSRRQYNGNIQISSKVTPSIERKDNNDIVQQVVISPKKQSKRRQKKLQTSAVNAGPEIVREQILVTPIKKNKDKTVTSSQ